MSGRTPLAAGVLGGLVNFFAARQQGRAYRKDRDEQKAWRQQAFDFQKQQAAQTDREQRLANIQNMLQANAQSNPTHQGDYARMGLSLATGQAQYGATPEPAHLLPPGQRGPVSPEQVNVGQIPQGPSPLDLAQQLAALTRKQKLEDDARNFQQQEELAKYQHGLGQGDKANEAAQKLIPEYGGQAALPALRTLYPGANFGPPSTPDQVTPGTPASIGAPPPDAGAALMRALRGRLTGGGQTPNLLGALNPGTPDTVIPGRQNPLESLPVSPEVTARIGAQKAAEENARQEAAIRAAADKRAQRREPYDIANIESQITDRVAGRQQSAADRAQRQSNADRDFQARLRAMDETERQNDQSNVFKSRAQALQEAEARVKASGSKGDNTRLQALKARANGRLQIAEQLVKASGGDDTPEAAELRRKAEADLETIGTLGLQRGQNVGKDGFDDFDRALIKKLQGSGMPYTQAANAVRNDKAAGRR